MQTNFFNQIQQLDFTGVLQLNIAKGAENNLIVTVLLSTISNIDQPNSGKYETVANLPFVTEEFGALLQQSEEQDDTPSCSLAEALEKQDLFINASLVQMGCSLLWGLFRNGLTPYRGFFHNLKDFRTQPIQVA